MLLTNKGLRSRVLNRRFSLRLLSYLPALLLIAPLCFLFVKSMGLSQSLLEHVGSTLFFEALSNTLLLLTGVTVICLLISFPVAWLLARYEFKGAAFWRWALIMPLALPAYVMTFVWISWADYSGLVPTFLRDVWGAEWTLVFSHFRSLAGLVIPLSLALFPYLYLLIFEGLDSQSRTLNDAARSLGLGRARRFFKLEIPVLLPWIVSGILLVGMETLADFGSVSVFNLNVFTTIVYRSWFALQSIETASFFALVHVAFLVIFVSIGLYFVKRRKHSDPHAGRLNPERYVLGGSKAIAANIFLAKLWLISFLLPVLQLSVWSFSRLDSFVDSRLLERAFNSLSIATFAAGLAVVLAATQVLAHRYLKSRDITWAEKISSLGYGIPGTVIAVAWMASITVLWGSLHMLPVVALLVLVVGLASRFLVLAQRPAMSAAAKISPSVEEASQSSGSGTLRTLLKVHFPLLRNSFLMGFLFVFIDTLKEMPMTLLMRPFGWDTLAVRVYQYTSDGMWRDAAVPALLIVVASFIPIFLLRRRMK